MNKILILDGNSLINRAYYAMPNLKTKNGVFTGGIFGVLKMLVSLKDKMNPTHMVVCFDLKGPTFRHAKFSDYKGNRKGMPEELAMQMPIMKDVLTAVGISYVQMQGYEADDLIGTISKKLTDESFDVSVITGDKDALQLVEHGIKVYITNKGTSDMTLYDDEEVYKKLGVYSGQVVDFKALMGDNSDNIPGVKGIGVAIAKRLLAEYESLDDIIKNIDSISPLKVQNLLKKDVDMAYVSKELATIDLNAPLEFTPDDFIFHGADRSELLNILSELQLNKLYADLLKYFLVSEDESNAPLQKEIKKSDYVFDEKIYGHFDEQSVREKIEDCMYSSDELPSLIEAYRTKKLAKRVFYIRYEGGLFSPYYYLSGDEFYYSQGYQTEFFSDDSIEKIGFDIKNEYLEALDRNQEFLGAYFDVMIAAFTHDANDSDLTISGLSLDKLSAEASSEEEFFGKGKKKIDPAIMPLSQLNPFAMRQLLNLRMLYGYYQIEMDYSKKLFRDIEMPLIEVLAGIEYEGFGVDNKVLDLIDEKLTKGIVQIEEKIHVLAGEKFNIASPKQLGDILFEKLNLPHGRKTKTGYSTGADVLDKLKHEHDIVRAILEYRQLSKLKSTYIDGIRPLIYDGKVHTRLEQTNAVTGRLSSKEPNLQNIPIRTEMGRELRKLFIAEEGCVLLDADYSQIELRVLAHLSGEPKLIEAYKNDEDIHSLTASQVFGSDISEVTSDMRSVAKAVNFGIVYGQGDFGLSESLGIPIYDAKRYIQGYFQTYPQIKEYMNKVIESCKEKGYSETMFGRRRYLPDITSKNFMIRSAAERVARNTPIQGSAAEIIKIAMIDVYRTLKQRKLKSKLILQVHDELIINTYPDEVDEVRELLINCMEKAVSLNIPLKADVSMGKNWFETK